MNETNPPPNGVICPNCGVPQNRGIAYCANCGAPLPAAKSGGNALATVAKILVISTLLLGALAVGVGGACVVMLGGVATPIGGSSNPMNSIIAMIGIAVAMAIAAFGLAIFWFIKK